MGQGSPPGTQRPPGADPPRWLLALGCAALGLLLGGVLLGGEPGARLVALACIAFPTLVSAFLALLARRYLPPPDTR